jgi:2-iminobutanoate/2-iminopropanoate deaminase
MTQSTLPPISRLRRSNGFVFLSGELPLQAGGDMPEGIEAQTSLTLDRIEATLKAQGLGLDDVISISACLTQTSDFAAFNRVYAARFCEPRPVRTTVCTALMLPGALVELTAIAVERA